MTGADLLSRIRDDRNLRDLPVVMVTAQAFGDYVAEAAESEIDAYLLKPLTIKLLAEKVSYVVEKANNPSPMVAHLKEAMLLEEEGDLKGAIREAKLAMKADPESSRPIRDLGYYYYKKEDFGRAEKWLLKAAGMNHMDVFAFHHLGELYLKCGNIEKAQHYFEKAMKISPRHLSRGINFGKILVQMNMKERAQEVFDKALQLSGSTLELREEIADYCLEQGINKYASRLLLSIIREQPHRPDLLLKVGVAMEASGEAKKAVSYLNEANRMDGGNEEIKIHLARNYLTLGKPIWAEKALKEIIKVNPSHVLANELLRQCVQTAGVSNGKK
jgi:tetratricopeptide (TPR) repeat protein